MYENTLSGLFAAVKDGHLSDVLGIIKSEQVNLNELNDQGQHIVNYALKLRDDIPDDIKEFNFKTENAFKIYVLIMHGAIPLINEQTNSLLDICCKIRVHRWRLEILGFLEKSSEYIKAYSTSHIQAAKGIQPANETALIEDCFGFYPIYYAIASEAANEQWFSTCRYDYFKKIETGIFSGMNLAYFLLFCNQTEQHARVTQNLSDEEIYELLKTAPSNPQNIAYGMSAAWLYLKSGRSDLFDHSMSRLNPAQRYEIFKTAPLSCKNIEYGKSVASLYLDYRLVCDDIETLTPQLTRQQRYELLEAVPLHPQNISAGTSQLWLFLHRGQYNNFNSVTQDLTAEQRYKLLMTAPFNTADEYCGISVAWLLVNHEPHSSQLDYDLYNPFMFRGYGQYDIFARLMHGLSPRQYYEILKAAPLNPINPRYGETVFYLLIKGKYLNDAIKNVVSSLEDVELKELLSRPVYYPAKRQADRMPAQYSTVLIQLISAEADFARQILDEKYVYMELIQLYNALKSTAEQFPLVCFLCFKKLNQILLSLFSVLSNKLPDKCSGEHPQEKDIKVVLQNLFICYRQIRSDSKYYKPVNEMLGMLLWEASKSMYKEVVCAYLEESNNLSYMAIKNDLASKGGVRQETALSTYACSLRSAECDYHKTDRSSARELMQPTEESKLQEERLRPEIDTSRSLIALTKRPAPESNQLRSKYAKSGGEPTGTHTESNTANDRDVREDREDADREENSPESESCSRPGF